MKTEWILIALMSASLALAQDQPNPPTPPSPPRDEANRGPQPPPPPGGERGEMRPPLPPREGFMQTRSPMDSPQNFESALQRELGPRMEELKQMGAMVQEQIEQARRLFQERRFEEGRAMLHAISAQAREMRELKQRDPERFRQQQQMAEMERHSVELGQKIRRATDDETKKSAAAELKELLNKLFDLRQVEREKSLQQLEREVKEVREALEKRKAKRDEMIQHRFDQLTGRAELMEW